MGSLLAPPNGLKMTSVRAIAVTRLTPKRRPETRSPIADSRSVGTLTSLLPFHHPSGLTALHLSVVKGVRGIPVDKAFGCPLCRERRGRVVQPAGHALRGMR